MTEDGGSVPLCNTDTTSITPSSRRADMHRNKSLDIDTSGVAKNDRLWSAGGQERAKDDGDGVHELSKRFLASNHGARTLHSGYQAHFRARREHDAAVTGETSYRASFDDLNKKLSEYKARWEKSVSQMNLIKDETSRILAEHHDHHGPIEETMSQLAPAGNPSHYVATGFGKRRLLLLGDRDAARWGLPKQL
ncbi:unnamed protein product, partial [Amoebophrya sp. A25]|eukprot:GSA25T00002471001.1